MPLLAMEAFQPYFNFIAGLSSIVGLIVSLWVLFRVGRLEKRFLFKARVPELRVGLDKLKTELSGLLREYDENEDEIRALIGKSKVLVTSIQRKVDAYNKKQANQTLKSIKLYNRHPSKENSREVNFEMMYLLYGLEERLKDVEWES